MRPILRHAFCAVILAAFALGCGEGDGATQRTSEAESVEGGASDLSGTTVGALPPTTDAEPGSSHTSESSPGVIGSTGSGPGAATSTGGCEPDKAFCDGVDVRACTSEGEPGDVLERCDAAGEGCLDGACTDQFCVPGATRCSDSDETLVTCSDDGMSETRNSCGEVNRRCESEGSEASCGACVGGTVEREGECVTATTCSQLDCPAENRICRFVDGAPEPSCAECAPGFVERDGSCVVEVTCGELGCSADNRECLRDGSGNAIECGDCLEGYAEREGACVPPVGVPGSVVATQGTTSLHVRITWGEVAGASGYNIYREGERLNSVPLMFANLQDPNAPAPPRPTSDMVLSATESSTNVDLSWTPTTLRPGAEVSYRVSAIVDGVEGDLSAPAVGWRGPWTLQGYEVSVDGGAWTDVGTALTWRHADARRHVFAEGTKSVSRDRSDHVRLQHSAPETTEDVSHSYRVRARSTGGTGDASAPATGRRALGTLSLQWQWASSRTGSYTNLSGATTLEAFDTAIAPGTSRWYRFRASAPGAASALVSAPQEGTRIHDSSTCASTATNTTQPDALALTYGQPLSEEICTGVRHWYSVNARPGDFIEIDLLFTHAEGDLDMRLHSPTMSRTLASGFSTNDNEYIGWTVPDTSEFAGLQTYFIEVYGFQNAANLYTIEAKLTPDGASGPQDCIEDSWSPNHSAEDAKLALSFSESLNATICDGNDDYFRVNGSAEQTVTLTLEWDSDDGELDIHVMTLEEAPQPVERTDAPGRIVVAWQLPVWSSGVSMSRIVRISGVEGTETDYTLSVAREDFVPPPCRDGTRPPNTSLDTAAPLPLNESAWGFICGESGEPRSFFYFIDLAVGERLDLDLTYESLPGARFELYLRGPEGAIVRSETGRTGEDALSYRVGTAVAGRYTVEVRANTSAGTPRFNEYELDAAVTQTGIRSVGHWLFNDDPILRATYGTNRIVLNNGVFINLGQINGILSVERHNNSRSGNSSNSNLEFRTNTSGASNLRMTFEALASNGGPTSFQIRWVSGTANGNVTNTMAFPAGGTGWRSYDIAIPAGAENRDSIRFNMYTWGATQGTGWVSFRNVHIFEQ